MDGKALGLEVCCQQDLEQELDWRASVCFVFSLMLHVPLASKTF